MTDYIVELVSTSPFQRQGTQPCKFRYIGVQVFLSGFQELYFLPIICAHFNMTNEAHCGREE